MTGLVPRWLVSRVPRCAKGQLLVGREGLYKLTTSACCIAKACSQKHARSLLPWVQHGRNCQPRATARASMRSPERQCLAFRERPRDRQHYDRDAGSHGAHVKRRRSRHPVRAPNAHRADLFSRARQLTHTRSGPATGSGALQSGAAERTGSPTCQPPSTPRT